ncbi:SDR family NAD(P)-dependent oxidoreductase [Sphingomonas sp. TDK1]|uniref:SDR family NAD(P)-dependent oxidoreductase n=1 Tax=Sphingomonas sp. TDK1 TaxID=453247 RepID=UPI0007D92428|nr:SDR family oxidoreductase [Sphingomonas sp. TDK1]OAN58507.1 short-chain dehydrogenase [Sphingomonas sp. TDK1]
MNDAYRLDGKTAVVTGGGGGIGSVTCALLAARGARVVVADIDLDRAQQVAQAIDGADSLGVDLADAQSIQSGMAQVVARHGGVDILVNNAAMLDPEVAMKDISVETMDVDVWDRIFAVNMRGTMLMCREALPHLRARRGNIVNVVSNLALQGHVLQAAYAASKAGVVQLTRSIAASHGRQGVRCNAVAPGMTLTPALKANFPAPLRKLIEDETLREQLGEPEDIAEAIAFLASDAARNFTAQVLVCDGGQSSHVPAFTGFRDALGL